MPDRAKAAEGEDAEKIFPLRSNDKNIAYALAGNVANPDLPFDAVVECTRLAEEFRQRDIENQTKFVNGFSMALRERIQQQKHFPEIDKNANGDWKIMELFFVGYLKAVPFVFHVEFFYSLASKPFAEFHSQAMSPAGLLYGSDVVRRAMYDDFWNAVKPSPFADFIQEPHDIRSLNQSHQFVEGYIQACSSELALKMDEAHCKKIGGRIRIAEITPSGFKWRPVKNESRVRP